MYDNAPTATARRRRTAAPGPARLCMKPPTTQEKTGKGPRRPVAWGPRPRAAAVRGAGAGGGGGAGPGALGQDAPGSGGEAGEGPEEAGGVGAEAPRRCGEGDDE